jgi:hypothetical protein
MTIQLTDEMVQLAVDKFLASPTPTIASIDQAMHDALAAVLAIVERDQGWNWRPDGNGGWASGPVHPTCVDVTTWGRPPGSEWICGPQCPRGDAPATGLASTVAAETGAAEGSGGAEAAETFSGRFDVWSEETADGGRLWMSHHRHGCVWSPDLEQPADLAELNQRAGEHAEVCW